MEKSAMTPSVDRSSGTKPTPASSTSRTDRPTSSTPSSWTDPATGDCSPSMTSVSSVWPLPCTPAIATISPRLTSNETSSSWRTPASSMTVRSRTWTVLSPGTASVRATPSDTERPTMSEASSVSEAVGSAVPTTLPRRITVMRSATARTSRSLWVMKTIEVPDSRS